MPPFFMLLEDVFTPTKASAKSAALHLQQLLMDLDLDLEVTLEVASDGKRARNADSGALSNTVILRYQDDRNLVVGEVKLWTLEHLGSFTCRASCIDDQFLYSRNDEFDSALIFRKLIDAGLLFKHCEQRLLTLLNTMPDGNIAGHGIMAGWTAFPPFNLPNGVQVHDQHFIGQLVISIMNDGKLVAKVISAEGDEAWAEAHKLDDLLIKVGALVKDIVPPLPAPSPRPHRRFA